MFSKLKNLFSNVASAIDENQNKPETRFEYMAESENLIRKINAECNNGNANLFEKDVLNYFDSMKNAIEKETVFIKSVTRVDSANADKLLESYDFVQRMFMHHGMIPSRFNNPSIKMFTVQSMGMIPSVAFGYFNAFEKVLSQCCDNQEIQKIIKEKQECSKKINELNLKISQLIKSGEREGIRPFREETSMLKIKKEELENKLLDALKNL